MTTLTRPRELWNTMPGWGIVVDLTPPELINSRQIKVLRKWLVTGLVALLVCCLGGYVLATRKHSSASGALRDAKAQTAKVQADTRQYDRITTMQGTVAEVRTKIATLMSGDVDLTSLMDQIRGALPNTMTIKQESVTLSLAGVVTAGASGGGLGTAGHASIGNVTITGEGRTLDDLSRFVDKLRVIPGLVNVVPVSNIAHEIDVEYSLTFGLTDTLLSHRFDSSKGGK